MYIGFDTQRGKQQRGRILGGISTYRLSLIPPLLLDVSSTASPYLLYLPLIVVTGVTSDGSVLFISIALPSTYSLCFLQIIWGFFLAAREFA
uniref:Uncharacterized protein n=1 Tax=Lactuca sativa TaxID=4236 RepID=A0A9R1WI38_LACSA|nr:hypothetical protein LSAT_V11C100040120 [Lactuca sativa]